MAYVTTSGEAKPLYCVRRFNDEIYKIIRFNRAYGFSDYVVALSEASSTGKKSEPAFSRARRMVFEKALCNEWDFFFTGTLDPQKYDRHNLAKFRTDLTEFFKYRRRVYGTELAYLLVPEQHKDGAWHMHGLIKGVPEDAMEPFTADYFKQRGLRVNCKLLASPYLCWNDYFNKFGFCSMDKIASPVGVSYYITKYVSKDLVRRSEDLGQHLYFSSQGLKTAEKLCDIYIPVPELDDLCTQKYEFCSTGFVYDSDWTFAVDMLGQSQKYADIQGFEAPSLPLHIQQAIDRYQVVSDSQVVLKGF